jgi:hypothetical protein
MASDAVAMVCGKDVIGWGEFTAVLNQRFSIEFPVNDLQLIVYRRLQPLYRAKRKWGNTVLQSTLRGHSPLAGLINVLVETRFKLCTNSRDKVFALHSLFKGLDTEFPDLDYTKSVEQVFCEATEAVFKQDRHLRFLYHVSHHPGCLSCHLGFQTGVALGRLRICLLSDRSSRITTHQDSTERVPRHLF